MPVTDSSSGVRRPSQTQPIATTPYPAAPVANSSATAWAFMKAPARMAGAPWTAKTQVPFVVEKTPVEHGVIPDARLHRRVPAVEAAHACSATLSYTVIGPGVEGSLLDRGDRNDFSTLPYENRDRGARPECIHDDEPPPSSPRRRHIRRASQPPLHDVQELYGARASSSPAAFGRIYREER